ncbi:uncharacterized protein CANTADRAFT_27019 [Suhomyces tanzawaensis NRRL Y-17324]|uniref:DUF1746 domain-containing protein n=1 Tax=Suhomyces tanzawaensis NRRL Y-17324 TaxID=984487 RepID=A0A1E4SF11_9ASCO|nr:uncharacterized protein CANTADRAFT_27019 [Suhomyces tanzawaensis NRRL Y-17324]ODV78073.1 hypothetical protein CANTADRAFT_27019 [Suhomyces tanzawaensis NRRL Y-17324]
MAIDLETHLSDFLTQTYPTVEQTIVNNASVLSKRKRFFLQDLRHSFKAVGFILLAIIYLRDQALLMLIIRGLVHVSISNPFTELDSRTQMSDENKKGLTKFLLTGVLVGNVCCFLVHAYFGVYTDSPWQDKNLHGYYTVQFIGERLPYSVIELLLLDVLLFVVQIVFHALMCVTNDAIILDQKRVEDNDNIDEPFLESDGYNGGVFLTTLDLIPNIYQVLSYQLPYPNAMARTNLSTNGEVASRADRIPHIPPGAFV